MPLWITLRNVPEEFLSGLQDMANTLGVVLGCHQGNPHSLDQKFCIVVKVDEPFVLVLEAINPISGESTLI